MDIQFVVLDLEKSHFSLGFKGLNGNATTNKDHFLRL